MNRRPGARAPRSSDPPEAGHSGRSPLHSWGSPRQAPEVNSSISTSDVGALTVCVVEDHPELRQYLEEFLRSAGHVVLGAVGTFREGRAVVVERLPDVAIIDNQLPDGRGVDLCRELCLAVPAVMLLLHTGVVSDDLRAEAASAGAAAVIAKSVRGTELLEALRGRR